MYTVVYGVNSEPEKPYLHYFPRHKLAVFEGNVAYEGGVHVAHFEDVQSIPLGEMLVYGCSAQFYSEIIDVAVYDSGVQKVIPLNFGLVGEVKDILNKAKEKGLLEGWLENILYISGAKFCF